MNQHNTLEKRLKSDIHDKNELRRELAFSLNQLHSWQEKLVTISNIRKEKKLNLTVVRYANYIHELKLFLTPVLDELEGRIKSEMDFSVEEIEQFRAEVKTETEQAAQARIAFENAKKLLEGTEEKKQVEPEELAAARQAYSKAFKAFRLEKTELETAQQELASELRDREIFKLELKRIMIERHFMAEV
ncbi:MAG: hypothetical protein KAS73_04535 [Candidatus Sabulitectum sp.]|nr:hypothetical protein [Candidatus Sabulitectum sp.]